MTSREIDPDRLKMFSFGVFSQLSGAVTAGMIHLGEYRTLNVFTFKYCFNDQVHVDELTLIGRDDDSIQDRVSHLHVPSFFLR